MQRGRQEGEDEMATLETLVEEAPLTLTPNTLTLDP